MWHSYEQGKFAHVLGAQVRHLARAREGFVMFPTDDMDEDGASSELREHALAHAASVVLVLSQRDVDSIARLGAQLADEQSITNCQDYRLLVELVVILELLHRKAVRRLIPVLCGDVVGDAFEALDVTAGALRRIEDIASTRVVAEAKTMLGRMSGVSDIGLWESELTLRGLVRAATDELHPAIEPVQVSSVAESESQGQVQAAGGDALAQAIARRILGQAGVAAASVAHEPAGAPPPTTAQEDVQQYYNKHQG